MVDISSAWKIIHTSLTPTLLVIAAQILFLALGIATLEFHVSWLQVVIAVAVAASVELALSNLERSRRGEQLQWFLPLSAIAAGLGVGIFFRASESWYFALPAALAIISKYFVRIGGVHIFNPSNFGVVVSVLLFTGTTTIEFTQWGQNTLMYLVVAVICFGVCWYARALATTLSFLASYAILLIVLTPLAPDIFSIHHYGLLGPSLILFASFMLTDPRTSPQKLPGRLLHGFSAALLFFALEALGVRYSIFIASFAIAAMNGASRLAPQELKTRLRMDIFPNALSVLVIGLVAVCAFIQLPTSIPSQVRTLSIQYLFFGVESSQLAQCSPDARFRAITPEGLQLDAATEGVAWGDYDRDGDDDLFLSNIAHGTSALYRNDDGAFIDVTKEAGLPHIHTYSAFFADYDNTGTLDLFLVVNKNGNIQAWEPFNPPEARAIEVYKNIGGVFHNATEAVGLGDFVTLNGEATLSFADYDNNGFLDILYASNGEWWYLLDTSTTGARAMEKSLLDPRFPPTRLITCEPDDVRRLAETYDNAARGVFTRAADRNACISRAFGLSLLAETPAAETHAPLDLFLATPGEVHLFRNRGGRFTEVSEFSETVRELLHQPAQVEWREGAESPGFVFGRFWQPVSFDYDSDRLPDIFLNDDFGTNVLLKNEGDFTFSRQLGRGIDYFGSGMGSAIADFNKDGTFDIFTDNVLGDFLYFNDGNGAFSLGSQRLGPTGIGWGAAALDFDLDGREDLAIGNGDAIVRPKAMELSRDLFRGVLLYRGTERGFVNATGAELCAAPQSVRGLAVADYNNDGTPDIFSADLHERNSVLYENTSSDNAYMKVRLQGTRSNRMGVGAKVTVISERGAQIKTLLLGDSFYSQNSATLLFGLGQSEKPVEIIVEWPSGTRTELKDVEPNQTLNIIERL